MLEMFQLRKQLEECQQELSHALYQHDAACRVIARLIKERDQARSSLAQLQATAAAAPPAPVAPPAPQAAPEGGMEVEKGITQEIVQKLQGVQKQLSGARRNRVIPPTLLAPEAVATYHCTSTHPLHKTTQPGITALATHSDQSLIATGGVDGQVIFFSPARQQVVSTLAGHTKKVTDVAFHPTQHTLYSASADRTVCVWGEKPDGQFDARGPLGVQHAGDVTGVSVHPCGDYLATGSLDDTWAFVDLASGAALAQVASPPEPKKGIECVQFHPDGLILGTAGASALVKLWDVKTQANVAKCEGFSGPVKTISFSENGVFLASASADNTVRLWDLRKLNKARSNFRNLVLPEGFVVQHVAFDHSGNYLAIAGNDIRIYNTKTWDELCCLRAHEQPATRALFGRDATGLISASMDRTVRLWAPTSTSTISQSAQPEEKTE